VLQSLSDPLFAVPFLGALAAGCLGVAIGVGYAWLMDRRADARLERLSARVGGAGLAGIGVAIVAFGFNYAGTIAQLVRGPGNEPSLSGRIGLALPWEVIAGTVGAAALGCVFASMGLSVYAARASSDSD
jgi:hypothetical protein